MCRNIKTLFNFDPPATPEEIRAASLQFVRKISGFNRPSKGNAALFHTAVEDVAGVATRLLRSLETSASPKNREEETAKAKARAERQTKIHHKGTEHSQGGEIDLRGRADKVSAM